MRHPESQAQRALVAWWQMAFRGLQVPSEFLLFAVPNAAKVSNPITARIRKAEGLRAGIPDLCLALPRGPYHGLFIELKVEKNTPTDHQRSVLRELELQGYAVAIPIGFEAAKRVIEDYLRQGKCEPLNNWLAQWPRMKTF